MHEKLGRRLPGFTTCPASMFTAFVHRHDPYTSVPGDDHRVSCHDCNRVTSEIAHELRGPVLELPEAIQRLVLELTSLDFASDDKPVGTYRVYRVCKKGLFSDPPTDDDNRRAVAAVAQGHADTLLEEAERMTILFSLSTKQRNDRIKLTYLPQHVDRMSADPVDPEAEDMQAILEHAAVSPERAKAIRGLLRNGFTLVTADLNSMMKRILLRNTTETKAYDGVTAEFTWLD